MGSKCSLLVSVGVHLKAFLEHANVDMYEIMIMCSAVVPYVCFRVTRVLTV